VEKTHDQVGDPEQHCVCSECVRDGEGDDEHRSHPREHARPDPALLGLERVREPGIARPRPPQHGEHEQPAADSPPGWVVRHELRHLRDGVDEDEVEEELEGSDPVFAFGLWIVHP
jgi:hypothetical protein